MPKHHGQPHDLFQSVTIAGSVNSPGLSVFLFNPDMVDDFDVIYQVSTWLYYGAINTFQFKGYVMTNLAGDTYKFPIRIITILTMEIINVYNLHNYTAGLLFYYFGI